MKNIHVGFLLSYDYDKLKNSIPPVYKEADRIFIAQDIENRTWNGQKFEVEQKFFDWLNQFDKDNKISIYKDNFYEPELSTIQNDNREREMLSKKMGIGNWLIQIDSDEYFLDFSSFVKNLRKYDHYLENPSQKKVQIAGWLINLYKYTDGGVLYVKEATRCLAATNYPNYKVARQTKEQIIYTNNLILHECLSRNEEELEMKFNNWGHNVDINKNSFMEKWRKVNKTNYKEMQDFFYIEPEKWKSLEFAEGKSINALRENIKQFDYMRPSSFFVWKKNMGQAIKHKFKRE